MVEYPIGIDPVGKMAKLEMNQHKNHITRLTHTWRVRILLLASLTALISVLAIGYASLLYEVGIIPTVLTAMILAFLVVWFVFQVFPSHNDTVRLIDHQLPALQNSSQLLLEESSSDLHKLQIKKISASINEKAKSIKWPLPWTMVWFIAVVTMVSLGTFYLIRPVKPTISNNKPIAFSSDSLISNNQDSLFLQSLKIVIAPPEYTGLKFREAKSPDFQVPEGSSVSIRSSYSLFDVSSQLVINEESISGKQSNAGFRHSASITENAIYQLVAKSEQSSYQSPFHLIEIIPDSPPKINVSGISQYQRFDWYEPAELEFDIQVQDDYGLSDVFLSITLTEGDGESIRFREQKIDLLQNDIRTRELILSQLLSGKAYDMAPGNELYFHIEAVDNHPSGKQRSKSSTYFFAINDTSEVEFSLAGDLGADIMPDYFKSQLQLIIDTEKLLEQKKQLSKTSFNNQSNELAFEQKQLRLRYGQFMGEEDDSGLDIDTEQLENEEDHDHEETDVLKEFGHDHDHENEEGQWLDRGTESHDDHDHGDAESSEGDPLDAFLHLHEDEETATFYTVSLKAKLRAAMNEMWDSELYLRMYQPEQSLPYQYAALKLLKEIKNHARIYVKRVGFEPTPINEVETRLSKNPDRLSLGKKSVDIQKSNEYDNIRRLIEAIEREGYQNPSAISKRTWSAAGAELSKLSLENPGNYLKQLNAMQLLQSAISTDSLVSQALYRLTSDLSSIISSEKAYPGLEGNSANDLEKAYWQAIQNIKSK